MFFLINDVQLQYKSYEQNEKKLCNLNNRPDYQIALTLRQKLEINANNFARFKILQIERQMRS